MWKYFVRYIFFVASVFLPAVVPSFGGTVVFFEKDFPSAENSAITRSALESALASLHPRFIGLADLRKENALGEGDLLVLPYGSAFPADAWEAIHRHLDQGDLLILGGRPLFVPVYRDSSGWRVDPPSPELLGRGLRLVISGVRRDPSSPLATVNNARQPR